MPGKATAMAKTKQNGLAGTLHARGLRKRVANSVADAVGTGRSAASPKQVTKIVDELRGLAGELEDMVTGRSAKKAEAARTRRTAARKAARTRSENAAKRSAAARKGARTRAARSTKSR
jgi:ElaB/YqjD/DUF883 family membrane-anchored ribosome-binding protein